MFPTAMVAVVSFTTIAAVMFWIIVTSLSYIVTAVIVSCITASMLVEALKYHKLYQLETDSLYNAEKERAVGEIRAKYDMEQAEGQA